MKTIFKYSKKFKNIWNYLWKCNLYLYFLIQQKLMISNKKYVDVSKTEVMYHVIYIFFRSTLGKDNRAKFHHCRICVADFREEGPF